MPEEIEVANIGAPVIHPYAVQEMAAAAELDAELQRLVDISNEANAALEADPENIHLAFRAERAAGEWEEYRRYWRLIGEVTGYHKDPVKVIEFGV